MKRRTKVIATLGPATDAPERMLKLLEAGADLVRVNMSHGEDADHRKRVAQARAVAAELGKEVGVLADLPGPKIRVRGFSVDSIELTEGQTFAIDTSLGDDEGDEYAVGVTHAELPQQVKADDTLLLDDGLISLSVTNVIATRIECEVLSGGTLYPNKGLNRLGGGLALPALTERDRECIKLAADMEVDYLAISFVRTAEDMHEAKRLLRAAGGHGEVVSKIERAEALEQLDLIIEASDAVLVARGDLGVEIGDAELPGLQKRIIRLSLEKDRPVITATQMLQSMVDSPIPTRAEVLDVANAVIDGTDAVMLSAETAVGKHPHRAVAAMDRICSGAERQFEHREGDRPLSGAVARIDQAIALAAMFTANNVGVAAIVALSESGATAKWLSRYRSNVPIFGLSPHVRTRRRMTLYRDVYPVHFQFESGDGDEGWAAVHALLEAGYINAGDRLVVTQGDQRGLAGGTNTLRILRAGQQRELNL